MKPIRTVISGAGYRGRYLLQLLQQIPLFAVEAVYDPFVTTLENIKMYNGDDEGFRQMLKDNRPDLVIIASPWQCHIPQALAALDAGCHVALEIKGGLYLNEYQPIIKLASQKHLKIYPLENTVFLRENMAVYNLIRQGVLGDIIAMRGGYRHDLRNILIDDEGKAESTERPESIWRSSFYFEKNADLYPTHGFAPLCVAAGINHTDYITELTSFASRAQGLAEYIKGKGGKAPATVKTGDIIITQMCTEKGTLITLTHDTTLPRPRSLDFEIQGTKGIWQGFTRRIYLEGISPNEEWEKDEAYIAQYEHPLWKKWGKEALKIDRHHKGMDYMMLRTLAADLIKEEVFPTTGEDLALWTSVTPLSEISIREKRTLFLHHKNL